MILKIPRSEPAAGRTGLVMLLVLLALLSLTTACVSNPASKTRSLAVQVDDAARTFVQDAARQGTTAQSYFALFVPENTVNRRHRVRFLEALTRSFRAAAPEASLQLNTSADRVFFLSRHRASGWTPPAGGDQPTEALALACRNGTSLGWTSLHAFWGQYNRLLIGDNAWIQNLPESVRADLAHPLRYVVRATVRLTDNPDAVTYVHDLQLDLVEVGKERTIFSGNFPLTLSYPLP